VPDLEQEVIRGHEAERIIRSPLWSEAWVVYEERLTNSWAQSGTGHTDQRERIWLALQIARKVKSHLESIMKTGQLAQKQVEGLNHGK
jgi:hypothetical protein